MADHDITRKNIVKLRPATSENVVVPVRPQINISALARQHGLSRQTIRRRLATGWQPPRAPQVEIIESNQGVATLATPHGRVRGSYVAAAVLALAAVTLGGIQLAIDAQYAGGFGRTPVETWLQAMQGVGIGIAAMILPCVAAVLRRTGQVGWSRGAWAIWPGFLVLTIIAGAGFSAGGMSDAIAQRGGAIEQAASAKDQRTQAIAIAQRAVDTAAEARKAECAMRGPHCRNREADEKTALAMLNAAIAVPLPPAVTISAADPGGETAAANIAWASFGYIKATAADVQRTWIAGRVVMPAFAGLMLSMAVMVWPRQRSRGGRQSDG